MTLGMILSVGYVPNNASCVSVPNSDLSYVVNIEFRNESRERRIIAQLADYSSRFPELTLAEGFGLYSRRWGNLHGGRVCRRLDEFAIANDETMDTLDKMGITGDTGYLSENPNMKLRDYLALVPQKLLPDDYMY